MTTTTSEHPLVDTFRENGVEVIDYVPEEPPYDALIAFEGDDDMAERAMNLVKESNVELRGLRHARYFADGEPELTNKEILFRSYEPYRRL